MDAIGSPQGINAAHTQVGWDFIVLMSRQGKIRLSEFFQSYTESEKRRILRDIAADILPRAPKMCNIIEKGPYKFVYRRYASLYFVVGVPIGMNELIVLEQIHLFVEALDGYFNSGMLFQCPNVSESQSMAQTKNLLQTVQVTTRSDPFFSHTFSIVTFTEFFVSLRTGSCLFASQITPDFV